MADIKITDLTAYTDPVSTDVLPIVDVGSDVTKKVSIADLLENAGTGTAAAPSFSFDGDNNTGLYQPGADQLAISTNGTGRLFVNSSGNVFISGSTAATADIALNADGSAQFTGPVVYQNTSAPGGTTAIQVKDGSSTVFRVYANGETVVTNTAYFGSAGNTKLYANGGVDVAGNLTIGQSSTLTSSGGAQFVDDVLIGGVLPASPNIELNANGSAEFASDVVFGNWDSTSGSGVGSAIGSIGAVYVRRASGSNSTKTLFGGWNGTDQVAKIDATGGAQFASNVLIGGTPSSAPNIELNADGSGKFQSANNFSSNSSGGMVEFRSDYASTPATGNNNLIRLVSQTTSNYSAALIGLGKYEADGNARSELTFKVANTSLSAGLAEFKFRGDGKALLPGAVLIGGTLPSSPAISLNADGSTTFAGNNITITASGNYFTNANVYAGTNPSLGSAPGSGLASTGRVMGTASGSSAVWEGRDSATGAATTSFIRADGSATFAGPVSIGGTAAANTIDEYEEGTWTPVVTDGTNDATMNGNSSGTYVRIGSSVICTAYVYCSDTTSLAGAVSLKGLPFTNGSANRNRTGVAIGQVDNVSLGGAYSVAAHMLPGGNIVLYNNDNSSGNTSLQASEINNTFIINIGFSYRIV